MSRVVVPRWRLGISMKCWRHYFDDAVFFSSTKEKVSRLKIYNFKRRQNSGKLQ
jgi:hypothetical protein